MKNLDSVYKPVLSNPVLICGKTSYIGEQGIVVCVCGGQGIVEYSDLH